MKIIGGKRDYYDHIVGIYGFDDHIVYDRRNKTALNYKGATRFLFHICGETVPILLEKGTYINSDKDPLISEKSQYQDRLWLKQWAGRTTDQNKKKRQPLLCSYGHWEEKEAWDDNEPNKAIFIPCLADFGFPSIIPPEEMYQKIYAFMGWLKDNPVIPNTQTDVEKTVAHGFDKKTSFRPKIK